MGSLKFACVVAVATFLSISTICQAETSADTGGRGEIVGMNIPANVKAQADQMTNNVKWLFAFKFSQAETPFYRILGKDAAQHTLIVEVTTSGQPLAVRTAVSLIEIPDAARKALKASQPNFEAKTGLMDIQAVGMNDTVVLYYELTGTLSDQQEVVLLVSPDGKKIANAKDLAAFPKSKTRS